MQPPPSVARFAPILADVTAELRRGNNCLLTADKGWTQLLFVHLRQRLQSFNVRCEYVDGRPLPDANLPDEYGVMLTAITQLRRAVRGLQERLVVVLPHLDVMGTSDAGWTHISRELVPLLYEDPLTVLLGFRDPTLPLLAVVEKLFYKRYTIAEPFVLGQEVPVVAAESGETAASGPAV